LNEQRGKARQDKDGWSDEGGEPLPLPLPLQSKAKAKANIGMSVQKMGNGTTLFYRTIHCQEDINLLKNFPF
jgi:hypothetical protein